MSTRITATRRSSGATGNSIRSRTLRIDAHEKVFQVNDIHLLKQQEAQSLQDPGAVENWFGSIYQDRLVTKIHRALKRLNA